jgi:preprotein translocase subunit SecG
MSTSATVLIVAVVVIAIAVVVALVLRSKSQRSSSASMGLPDLGSLSTEGLDKTHASNTPGQPEKHEQSERPERRT